MSGKESYSSEDDDADLRELAFDDNELAEIEESSFKQPKLKISRSRGKIKTVAVPSSKSTPKSTSSTPTPGSTRFRGVLVKINDKNNNNNNNEDNNKSEFSISLIFSNKRKLAKALHLKRSYKKREKAPNEGKIKVKRTRKSSTYNDDNDDDDSLLSDEDDLSDDEGMEVNNDEEDDVEDEDGEGIGFDEIDDDELDDDELINIVMEQEENNTEIDVNKLSDRQRAKYFGKSSVEAEDLNPEFYQGKKLPKSVLALMQGNSKKKQLTVEELELRKADAARKRKTFNMRKLEAEKKETLRKLLNRKVEKVDLKKQEEENERRKFNLNKRKEILKHKALFSWKSKEEIINGERVNQMYYSMQ